MNDFVSSLIRTNVPIWVGSLVAWLGSIGVVLPDDANQQLVIVVGGLAASVYYALIRIGERKWPWLGKFLGAARAPVYVAAKDITPVNTPDVITNVVNKVDNLYETRSLS